MEMVEKKWRLKALLYWNLLALFLLLSFFSSYGKAVWDVIDLYCFQWLNHSLEWGRPWKLFWAFANHKNADWIEDIVILLFFLLSFRSMPGKSLARKLSEMLFIVLYAASVITCINVHLLRKHVIIHRPSPTILIEGTVRLSKEIPWMLIKDRSLNCFPSDHGTTALLFAGGFAFFSNRKLGFYALLYSCFLCLPRLISGAHWVSDYLIGSGFIAITTLSFALCTPFHLICIHWIEKALCTLYSKIKSLRSA